MKLSKLGIPDRLFGMETALITVFLPVVIVAMLMLLSLNIVIIPKISEYGETNKKLKVLEDQKKVIIEKKNYLLSIDQDELKKNSDFVSNALLAQKNGYVMVGLMSKMAKKFGYQVDSFSVRPGEFSKDDKQPVADKNGVAKLPISLVIIGPAGKYLDFINGVENSLPILSLDTLDMKNTLESSRIELVISAYYIEDKTKYEVDKLTLGDLTLDKEESDLLSQLSKFTVMEDLNSLEYLDTTREFVKYDRTDPFNL